MVTGSHNPPQHNGFKLVLGARTLYGDDIKNLGEIAGKGRFASGQGTVADVEVAERYVARLASDYRGKRELRVAGPCVTRGYYRQPEATAQAFDEEG